MKSHGINDKLSYQFDANWMSNDSNVSAEELLDLVSYSFNEFVESVTLSTGKDIKGLNSSFIKFK